MRKKRLIFALLHQDGYFVLSRNFRLQKVGDVNWLIDNYNLAEVVKSIDELAIISVSRNRIIHETYLRDCEIISKVCFTPKIFGGGIASVEDAKRLFDSGADKIIVNSLCFSNSALVSDLVRLFGSQAVVGCLDVLKDKVSGEYKVFVKNGSEVSTLNLRECVAKLDELGVGEIMIQSISQDGTGFGLDLAVVDAVVAEKNTGSRPIVLAGGAGYHAHLNILNFIGDSLSTTRRDLIDSGIGLAKF